VSGIFAVAVGGCTGKYIRPTTAEPVAATPEVVARGSYLVNQVSMCGVCHTPRVGGNWLGGERSDAYLAGGSLFDDRESGFKVVAPNITPDRETGVGAWTDDQVARATRDGIRHDDSLLMPPMPFTGYGVMSDEDVRAVVAYLRTVPPVKNRVDREQRKFPFMMRVAAKMGAIHHAPAQGVKAPPATEKKAYGAYLNKIGLCWECHSLGKRGPTDDEDQLMSGSRMAFAEPEYGKIYARNLTPDAETGLGKYTAEQIKQALKTGRRLDGKVMAPPMSLLIPHLSTWSEADLDALLTYLKSIKAIKYSVPERMLTPASKQLVGE
jgi:mono/diheme cytochrome c family protein